MGIVFLEYEIYNLGIPKLFLSSFIYSIKEYLSFHLFFSEDI